MLKIYIKTYNNLLFKEFTKQLNNSLKLKIPANFTSLPPRGKSFVVKKSPHVFGRSKEKYYLNTYSGVIILKSLRKKDLLFIVSLLKGWKYKEGLGLKFTIFN
jgi:ribosomal protein S10